MEEIANTSNELINARSDGEVRSLIHVVRGTQVMLDSDLARLFQVETKNLNRAAKRNEARFPEDFRFQLTKEELEVLRCQIGTLAGQGAELVIGRTYLPYAYTEQGVAMLSAVLRSDVAIEASVQIIRAFVEMRRFIASNAVMFEQIRAVELRQLEYQHTTDERFERVFDYMETHEAPRQKVFFEGQIYDAFELLVSLVQSAEREIVLVDGYVDVGTLNILAKKRVGVSVVLWTRPGARLAQRDVDVFNAQYPALEVHRTEAFHDRFLIIDGSACYLVGASLKDAGKFVLIPLNMRDGSVLARGRGNADWNLSAPHGAGRIMSRSEAKAAIRMDDYRASMEGIYTTSVSESTLDESPAAYKPIDNIIAPISETVDIVEIMRPIYNFKA